MTEFAAGNFIRVLARTLLSPFCMEILRPEQQVMQAALQVRSARAELLAGNVANADTPGYVARDLKFDTAMDEMMDAGGQNGSSSDTLLKPENLRFDKRCRR